jgi:hypothetical protein
MEVYFQTFLLAALEGRGGSVSRFGHFTPGLKTSERVLDRRLYAPQIWPICFGEQKSLLPLHDRPAALPPRKEPPRIH